MYQDYFGFSEMPFNITPDPKFLFLSPMHHDALAYLRYGIKEKKGFIVLTGEVGCGKTTLCRKLLNELDKDKYETALILNPRVQEQQLLRDFLQELGEPVSPKSDIDLVGKINNILLNLAQNGKEVVLIIDEAQNLSFEVLEQIRILSNLETDTQKLIQIILMGQPELKDKLKQKELRQLKQRILVHFDLSSLSFKETCMYIQHRLNLTRSSSRPNFTYWAMRKIFHKSNGIPRIINNICDKSLLASFVRVGDCVNYGDVARAIKEIRIT